MSTDSELGGRESGVENPEAGVWRWKPEITRSDFCSGLVLISVHQWFKKSGLNPAL
jgi:hypothetical protein